MTGDINEQCKEALRNYFEAAKKIPKYLLGMKSDGIPQDDALLFGFPKGTGLAEACKLIDSMARNPKRTLLTNIQETTDALGSLASV